MAKISIIQYQRKNIKIFNQEESMVKQNYQLFFDDVILYLMNIGQAQFQIYDQHILIYKQIQMGNEGSKSLKKSNNTGQHTDISNNKIKSSAIYVQQKIINTLNPICIQGDQVKELIHRSIVAIRIKGLFSKNEFVCGSGVLLSSNIVLTAAHNIFLKLYRRQLQKKQCQVFEVTADGVAEAFHEVEDWRYLEDFKTCKQSAKLQFDYALIKLKPNPNRIIPYEQFPELMLPCKCILDKDPRIKLDVYGYPASKPNYDFLNKQLTKMKLFQYGLTLQDSIVKVKPAQFKITYDVSTLGGMSGCPIIVGNQVVAIHTGEQNLAGQKTSNIGRIITKDLLRNIQDWIMLLGDNSLSISEKINCTHQVIKQQQEEILKTQGKPIMNDDKLIQPQLSSATIAEAEQLKTSADKLKEQYIYELGLEHYKKSMAIYEQYNGKDCAEVAAILVYGIGDIFQRQGKYQLALEAFQRGNAIYLEKEGKDSYNFAVSLERIGWVYEDWAEYDLALDNFQKALAITQKIKGKDSLQAGKTINNIGLVYWRKGDYTQALNYLKRSLQIYERAGKGNSINAAQSHNNIGNVYDDQEEYSLALQHYKKALKIYISIQGKDSADAALTMYNIGIIYYNQGDSPRAVEMYKRAIAIYEKHQLRHRDYANVQLNLGTAYYDMEDYGLAAAAYGVTLPIFEQMDLAADVKKSSLGLAQCLSRLGKKEEFERILKNYGVERSEI